MVKLAIVSQGELDPAFEEAAKPYKIEPIVHQQQRQDPPELADLKRKQQEMCP